LSFTLLNTEAAWVTIPQLLHTPDFLATAVLSPSVGQLFGTVLGTTICAVELVVVLIMEAIDAKALRHWSAVGILSLSNAFEQSFIAFSQGE
jgi:hypothetical protein